MHACYSDPVDEIILSPPRMGTRSWRPRNSPQGARRVVVFSALTGDRPLAARLHEASLKAYPLYQHNVVAILITRGRLRRLGGLL